MKFRLLQNTALALSVLALPMTAHAAGFYIQESSVSALGSAFSGSMTRNEDASVVFFNPAGMTDLEKRAHVNIGTHIIKIESEMTDLGTTTPGATTKNNTDAPYDAEAVPNAFLAIPLTDKVWFGAGFSAPFGLQNEYDSNWFGRYDSTKTELQTLNYTFNLAYEVNDKFSIGGGLDIQSADATLEAAAFAGTTEGTSVLTGDDVSFGYNLGFTYKPLQTTEIAVHYRSAISHELEGYVGAFGTGAGDFRMSGEANLDLPDILTIGAAHDMNDKLSLMAQLTWFGWNNFNDITATAHESAIVPSKGGVVNTGEEISSVVQDYDNTIAFAIGAEYEYSDKWLLRAGYQFDQTPTTDEYRTTRTPDGDRNWVTLGATYNVSEDIALDMAAAYINVAEEDINLSRNGTGALESAIDAKSESDIGIFSIGFNYKF